MICVSYGQKYLVNKHEKGNSEKEEDHLAAIVFNALGLMHNEEMRKIVPDYAKE